MTQAMQFGDPRVRPSLWERAAVNPETHCWEWHGHKDRAGYARLGPLKGYRLTYEAAKGPVPDGMHLDHLCRVRHCVNPAHLEPVTPYENWRRGQSASAINAQRTHCHKGHEYTPANTTHMMVGDKLHRRCRECTNARQNKLHAAMSAEKRQQEVDRQRMRRERERRDIGMVGRNLIKGHGLWDEGAVQWDQHGNWVTYPWGSTPLHAKCRCGALSPAGLSKYAAQKWHRQHKVDVCAAEAGQ